MRVLLKAKIGPFLGIFSVLALWTLLAAGSVQAHTSSQRLPAPSCGNLPNESGFLSTITIDSTNDNLSHDDSATTRGGSVPGRGDNRFRYARITVPELAAGELRVFDATAAATALSDAVLCRGSTQVARSITSYTAHNTALSAAARADDDNTTTTTDHAARAAAAATKASEANTASTTITYTHITGTGDTRTEAPNTNVSDSNSDGECTVADIDADSSHPANDETNRSAACGALTTALGTARSALSTARGALNTALSNLNTASRALQTAKATTTSINAAITAAQSAKTDYDLPANKLPPSSQGNFTELENVQTALQNLNAALGTAGGSGTGAAGALSAAATALRTAAGSMHTGFQIRAPVSSGDAEYIVVVASQVPSTPLPVDVVFHGAIATTATENQNRLVGANFAQDEIEIRITAPGLLTVETTGSTDTVGTLYTPNNNNLTNERAHAESGGSGGNFQFVVPVVVAATYEVVVEGQTRSTTGDYTLDMDFKVAMTSPTGFNTDGITPVAGPAWGDTAFPDDDTATLNPAWQIKRRAADGNTADEDYFLFTVGDDSGILTINANDDTGTQRDPDSNTRGTLFGPLETGPEGEKRVGQIATDADSGPGNHFRFTVPVEKNRVYLVKVEGTDGFYTLESDLDKVTHPTTTDPTVQSPSVLAPTSDFTLGCTDSATNNDPFEICSSTGALEVDRYLLNLAESGTLVVHSRTKRNTQAIDVVGTLYGPDGTLIAEDDNSGEGDNFRIAERLAAGLYILAVQGKAQLTQGLYELVINFVTGPAPDPDPTDPTDPPPPTVDADPTGELEDPPHNGSRSGIGLVRGWVCQDDGNGVEVRITGPSGSADSQTYTLTAPYGSSRGDVQNADPFPCEGRARADVGFAAQFNYNLLPAGTYTAEAFVGGEQVGQATGLTNTFTVVRISNDPYPIRLRSGEIQVPNFPYDGDTTILEWDQSSQNFQIKRKE